MATTNIDNQIRIADKLIVWRITDSTERFQDFKDTEDFISHVENHLSKSENQSFSNLMAFVEQVTDVVDRKMSLDQLALEIININVSQGLGLKIITNKKHIAYGTNKNKKKLVIKILI